LIIETIGASPTRAHELQMMVGAPVSIGKWIFWNQLPVTLGNIISGALFTGLALYVAYPVKRSSVGQEPRMATVERPESRSVLA
jgi:formate/nitrite transporter FocA (FNT family)